MSSNGKTRASGARYSGSNPDIPTSSKIRAGGGIGIRARLRILWGNPCEFNSRPAHHTFCPDSFLLDKKYDLVWPAVTF